MAPPHSPPQTTQPKRVIIDSARWRCPQPPNRLIPGFPPLPQSQGASIRGLPGRTSSLTLKFHSRNSSLKFHRPTKNRFFSHLSSPLLKRRNIRKSRSGHLDPSDCVFWLSRVVRNLQIKNGLCEFEDRRDWGGRPWRGGGSRGGTAQGGGGRRGGQRKRSGVLEWGRRWDILF